MKKKLEKANFDIKKVDAMMYAIEGLFMEVKPEEGDSLEKYDKAMYCYHAMWDEVRQVMSDLEDLDRRMQKVMVPRIG